MAEAQSLTEEIPGPPADPITAVGVVTSQSKAPAHYRVVAQTTDGSDADLWKDGLFKSKVTRYLCFSTGNSQTANVVVDMRLIDLKDTLPEGFTLLSETLDTQEIALRKNRLCVKLCPRGDAQTAVCDMVIISKAKHTPADYTCIGELNGMGIWYRMGSVHQEESTDVPISSPTRPAEKDPNSLYRRTSSRPDYQHQTSGLYTMSVVDDIPFMVSDKHTGPRGEMQQVNLMGITIKSLAEIEEEFYYNFSMEHSVAQVASPSTRPAIRESDTTFLT
ncbi:multivesicular body subunit 12Bb isoform X1 [Osmerus eperlanus]|uniref:multivesicular body subunit 12Bb isoform X1 n=1 Tax=Osmerus eperlanus TaxID=29151 RepID=UPI002E129CE0